MLLVEKEYGVKICPCGVRGKIQLIDDCWTSPRIHCMSCGLWCIGDSREDVVKRWNAMIERTAK